MPPCSVKQLAIEQGPPLVVVTWGSGGYRDFAALMTTRVLAACLLLPKRVQVIVVAGPYGNLSATLPNCLFIPSEPRLPTLFALADLVVGHAGYNTVHEVAQAGTPA